MTETVIAVFLIALAYVAFANFFMLREQREILRRLDRSQHSQRAGKSLSQ